MLWLKRTRVFLALFFLIFTTLIFLNLINFLSVDFGIFLTSLQLIPSLLKTISAISVAAIGLLFVLMITILFGRVYCSTICPLGVFQDIIIHISNRLKKKKRFKYEKPFYKIHYCLTGVIFVFVITGNLLLLNFLEPFSNYGRIITTLLNPAIILLNNLLSKLFELFDVLYLYNIEIVNFSLLLFLYSVGFLVLIIYLAYNHGRLFCNLLCPAGALLSMISRFSFFKLQIDFDNCKECGLCEKVCKANCINSDEMKIDFPACIGCFNCIKICPTVGINYSRGKKRQLENINIDKRRREVLNFLSSSIGITFISNFKNFNFHQNRSDYTEAKNHPISPPGSKSVDRFSSLCTACHLCVSSCPTHVLSPSFLEYGVKGIFQPRMNYSKSYCNYECVTCSLVCPSGAILPLTPPAKKEVQIGQVKFNKNDCIVVRKRRDCGACSEHCPTKAVDMVPFENGLMIPLVNVEICVGCGACEYVCPAEPDKAIYVKANSVHNKAKLPEVIKIQPEYDMQNFPF